MTRIKHKENWEPTLHQRRQAQSVYDFMQANKHKIDFSCSRDFAPAFTRPDGTHYDLTDPVEMRSFINAISGFRMHDIFRYRREVPGGKRVWSVNPVYVDKTGVVTHIPMAELPKPPEILPPAPSVDENEIRSQAVAFIEEEMKKIKVSHANICYRGVALDMVDVSLYQLYKIGLTIDDVCDLEKPEHVFSLGNTEQDDDSEEEAEIEASDQLEFGQVETESGAAF